MTYQEWLLAWALSVLGGVAVGYFIGWARGYNRGRLDVITLLMNKQEV